MTEALQIVTTTLTKEDAETLGLKLVERRLAACAQVAGPITSHYRWNDNIQISEEWMCIVKTERSHYAAVESAIRELHTYEMPEILAYAVVDGSRAYLDWLHGQLSDLSGPKTV